MPEYWKKDGATWRKAKQVWKNDGGTWRKAKAIWRNDGGTWRKVFSGDPELLLSNHGVNDTNSSAGSATLTVRNDGRLAWATTNEGSGFFDPDWANGVFDSSTCALYECLFTFVSGTNSSGGGTNTGFFSVAGDAYGTWNGLGTNRYRQISRSAGAIGGGTNSCTFDVSIRKIGTTTPVATGRMTLTAAGVPN